MPRATIRHVHRYTMLAKGKSSHWVAMDTAEASGGDGGASSPKELLLFALGGCTGMDVAEILRKRRLDVREFTLDVEADEVTETPKVFTAARITYRIDGTNIPREDVERAIHLSLEKYCSVSAMLCKAFPISWKALLNGEEIASGVEGDR